MVKVISDGVNSIVDGRQTCVSVLDRRLAKWTDPVTQFNLPESHVLTGLAINNVNQVAVSYYGHHAQLRIYDLRMATTFTDSTRLDNSSCRNLGFATNPKKTLIACLNQCGTLRLYKWRLSSLEPLLDYRCGKVEKNYLPECWFTDKYLYNTEKPQFSKVTINQRPY